MPDIFYTVGPQSEIRISELIEAGATGARLTFSYSTHETQLGRAVDLKKAAREMRKNIFVIADLEGSKARIGEFAGPSGRQSIEISTGEKIAIINAERVAAGFGPKTLPIPDFQIFDGLSAGSSLVVGDGAALIQIESDRGHEKVGRAVLGGAIEGRRGLFVRGATFKPKCLTDKDIDDLKHIAQHDEYDAVAVSFVSSGEDVENAKKIMRESGRLKPIIAKIETRAGAVNASEICSSAEYVMIARGDLALAEPWVCMPALVDEIVETCRSHSVPWIMATQIAEGLRYQSMLTRAEICDLWHWLKKGCSGVLLSHETAWGPRPVDAVRCTRELMDYAVAH